MTTRMIKTGDFCMVTNEALAADGLEPMSTVYVAALQSFPLTESDGYTQRIKLFVHKTTEEAINILDGVFVIDPSSVEYVGDDIQAILLEMYAPKEEVVATTD